MRTSAATAAAAAPGWRHRQLSFGAAPELSPAALLIAAAVLVWAAPALVPLAERAGRTAEGAQAPLILAAAGWVAWRLLRRDRGLAQPGRPAIALSAMAIAILLAIVARRVALVPAQLLAMLLGLMALVYGLAGRRALTRLWSAILLVIAAIPLPYSVEQALTARLKLAIARWSVDAMAAGGLDVANSGNMLYVDQYELMIDAACSGLNSIVGIALVGLGYVAWRHEGDWRRTLVLAAAVLPLAVVCNLVRVCLILAMVHRFGDRPLDTVLHPAMGIATFLLSLAALVLLDRALPPGRPAPARLR